MHPLIAPQPVTLPQVAEAAVDAGVTWGGTLANAAQGRFRRPQYLVPREQPSSFADFKADALRDMRDMALVIFGITIAVYKIGPVASYPLIFWCFFQAWVSKKDYFWAGVALVLVNTPGLLFTEWEGLSSQYTLPRIPLGFATLFPSDVFVIILYLKAMRARWIQGFVLSRHAIFLGIYLGLIMIPTSFFEGGDLKLIFNQGRTLFAYSGVAYAIATLWRSPEDTLKLVYALLPIAIFVIFCQYFLLATGLQFVGIVDPKSIQYVVNNTASGDQRALIYGEFIFLAVFLGGNIILRQPRYEIFPGVGGLIVGVFYLSVLLSATRSWISMCGVVIILMNFRGRISGSRFVQTIGVGILIVAIGISFGFISIDYLERNVFARFGAGLGSLLGGSEGEALANSGEVKDTLASRLENEFPKAWAAIMESPFFGFGLSEKYMRSRSSDIGFFNVILLVGFAGFAIFVPTFLLYIFKTHRSADTLPVGSLGRDTILALNALLYMMLLGFISTYDFFLPRQEAYLNLAVYLGASEAALGRRYYKPNEMPKAVREREEKETAATKGLKKAPKRARWRGGLPQTA